MRTSSKVIQCNSTGRIRVQLTKNQMPLTVKTTQKEPGVYAVAPCGALDTESAPDFEKALKAVLAANPKAIIIDMEEVSYITSMGISVVFKTKKSIEEMKGILVIANLKPKVQKIFELVKAIPEYIFTTMEEADSYLDTYLAENG